MKENEDFYYALDSDLDYAIKKFFFLTRREKKRKNNKQIQIMYLSLLYKIEEVKDDKIRLEYVRRLKEIIDNNNLGSV